MRNVHRRLVLGVVAGFTALVIAGCGDNPTPTPTSASAIGGQPLASGAVSLDVQGGNENRANTVTVCHTDDTGSLVPLNVNPNAVDGHLRHGDHLQTAEIPGNGIDDDCDPSTPDDVSNAVCPCADIYADVADFVATAFPGAPWYRYVDIPVQTTCEARTEGDGQVGALEVQNFLSAAQCWAYYPPANHPEAAIADADEYDACRQLLITQYCPDEPPE